MSSASFRVVIGWPVSLTASIWITAEPAANWTPSVFAGASTVAVTCAGVVPNVLGAQATVVGAAVPVVGATTTAPAADGCTVVVSDAGGVCAVGSGCVCVVCVCVVCV